MFVRCIKLASRLTVVGDRSGCLHNEELFVLTDGRHIKLNNINVELMFVDL